MAAGNVRFDLVGELRWCAVHGHDAALQARVGLQHPFGHSIRLTEQWLDRLDRRHSFSLSANWLRIVRTRLANVGRFMVWAGMARSSGRWLGRIGATVPNRSE